MISVIMPVHNAAPTLSAAVESVVRQSDPAWELVAVDDGSTDASGSILAAYVRQHRRIRVIRAERRRRAAALNARLSAAAGSLIARLDADDVCLPERLARQRGRLASCPAVGLVASRVRFGGDPGRAAGYARYVDWTNGLLTHEAISLARIVESPLAGVRMEKLAEPLLIWNDSPNRLSRRDRRYTRRPSFVVSYVSNGDAREQIAASLMAAGHRPGVDYILAA